MWIVFGQDGRKYMVVLLTSPMLGVTLGSSAHHLNDRLFRMTASTLFDSIYRGRVRPVDMLDISERYSYDMFNDFI